MSLEFTTATELVKLKIEKNKKMIELLDTENKILKKEMLLRYKLVEFNNERIKDIEKINDIEKQQLNNYSLVRESEVSVIIDIINNAKIDVQDIISTRAQLYNDKNTLMREIQTLESQIPEKTMVTNLKFVLSDNKGCRNT